MDLDYKKLKVLNSIAFLMMILVNALANILPINGVNTGEVASTYNNLFTPDKITFSIWGLIYIYLALFIIYQFGIIRQSKPKKTVDNLGILFILSCILNSLWIISWHYYKIGLSLLIMFLLLATLIGIYNKLIRYNLSENKLEYYFVRIPFSIYLGWISVATLANISVFVVSFKFETTTMISNIWLVITLIIGGIIAVQMLRRHNDIVYALVVIWAYIGIIIRWTRIDVKPNFVAIIAASIIIGMIFSNMKVFMRIKRE